MIGLAVHIQTGHGGFTLPLTHQPLTVGRSPDNLVHLDDELVSAHHCLILRIGDEVHALDLRSTGGTLLNGSPITFARLSPGDVLRIGRTQIKLAVGPTSARPPRAIMSTEASAMGGADEALTGPTISVVPASRLTESVTGKCDDSGAPIKVVPDVEMDKPIFLPPPRSLEELRLPRDIDAGVRAFLNRPSGMAVVCGPPGSGRTTTAYTMLRHLGDLGKTLVTFEQPPELQIENSVQIFVHDVREYAAQMERMLRGNPQVLFMGEPPPLPAANAGLRAAVGRCLVVCLSDAHDSLSMVRRWLDMGVNPRQLAAGLGLVIAQRLVKRLCDSCKRPVPLDGEAAQKLAPFAPHVSKIYLADSCPVCNYAGYVGRIAIFEMLQVGDAMRAVLMTRHPSVEDLRRGTDPRHYIPLSLSAYARVAQGLTTLEEADAVLSAAAMQSK